MIIGLDSAFAPTALEAQAAQAAGIRLWSGYLATRPQVGLYHVWTHADFDNARFCGATPIAFCSGWDDPAGCKALAAEWNVRLCLDVESGIRGDGAWVQDWLDASGAGLYGVQNVHTFRRASFHVLAWYIADPSATWSTYGRPTAPCGWQWRNSHSAFGVTVDQGYYDDWFLDSNPNATAGSEVRVPQEEILSFKNKGLAHGLIKAIYQREPTDNEMNDFVANVHDNGDNLADVMQGYANNVAKGTPLEQRVTALEDKPAAPPAPHEHAVTGTAK